MTPHKAWSVAVELPQHAGLSGGLTYLGPADLQPGTLVRVPLGRREVVGLVWAAADEHAQEAAATPLKPITEVLDALPPLGPQWRALLNFAADYYQRALGELALAMLPPELRRADAASLLRRVQKLRKRVLTPAQAQPSALESSQALPALPALTPQQEQVLSVCQGEVSRPFLLHGVTGSGKTEVYLRLAAQALQAGKQVLVLVPEINLTPQLEQRLSNRFSDHRLVSLHSRLTPAQRVNNWLAAHLGQADVILGTRLAVMASLPRLGLIVVDEEHDPSYKQQEGARYSARDMAVYRAHLEGIPVILGSATPSLESWRHAQEGRYTLLSMTQRVGDGELPAVGLIDMSVMPRPAKSVGGAAASVLSPALVAAIQTRIDRGEQSLLLLNRRGYAPVLHCADCGWKSACPHCSAWQVFHKQDRSLRCHHCGWAQRVPQACPECGNLDVQAMGRGTERLEEQLGPLLRGRDGGPARILRIDADSTRRAGELENHLALVHEGDVDVVVGTQMVAKGHDFRRMTLVAAVNPDGALFSSDFRAAERLFALLMQAAGRAGRDAAQSASSQMLVQTWHPTHTLYQALRAHDYCAFAQAQLDERQVAALPPYSHLALLRVEARTVQAAEAYLKAASHLAQQVVQEVVQQVVQMGAASDLPLTVYSPVPAAVARVANLERMQMLVESPSRALLQQFLRRWTPALLALRAEHKAVLRWALDVDPMSI